MWFLRQFEELYLLEKEISITDIESSRESLAFRSETKRFCRSSNRPYARLFRKSSLQLSAKKWGYNGSIS